MDRNVYVLVIAMLACILPGISGHHCTQTQVNVCTQQRDVILRKDLNTTDIDLHLLPENLVRIYCSFYTSDVRPCYRDIREHCTEEVRATFLGYEAALDFLCLEDFPGYLTVKSCLLLNTTQTPLRVCTTNYKNSYRANQKCSAIKEFISCESTVLRDTCGKNAEAWTRTFNTRLYQPELDLLQCNPQTTSVTRATTTEPQIADPVLAVWMIAVIACCGFLFFLLVISAVVCFVRCVSEPGTKSRSLQPEAPVINHIHHHHHPAEPGAAGRGGEGNRAFGQHPRDVIESPSRRQRPPPYSRSQSTPADSHLHSKHSGLRNHQRNAKSAAVSSFTAVRQNAEKPTPPPSYKSHESSSDITDEYLHPVPSLHSAGKKGKDNRKNKKRLQRTNGGNTANQNEYVSLNVCPNVYEELKVPV